MQVIIVIIILLSTINCGKSFTPTYMRSTEQRNLCHMRYHKGKYEPVQYKLAIVAGYNLHIVKHPKDYWGRCKK